MLAARLYGTEDLRIEEMPEPEPGPGEVKIRVAHAGICGTDVHEYFGTPRATHEPNPLTGATLPQTLGHEFAGTVVECGTGVDLDRVAAGDRVCVRPIRTCGVCPRCTSGLSHLCTALAAIGVTSPGGGLAEYVVVPAAAAHRLPDGVPLMQGALVEPMAVGLNAVERSGVRAGGAALVMGAGAVGMGALFALGAQGVDDVFMVEPSPSRRAAPPGTAPACSIRAWTTWSGRCWPTPAEKGWTPPSSARGGRRCWTPPSARWPPGRRS